MPEQVRTAKRARNLRGDMERRVRRRRVPRFRLHVAEQEEQLATLGRMSAGRRHGLGGAAIVGGSGVICVDVCGLLGGAARVLDRFADVDAALRGFQVMVREFLYVRFDLALAPLLQASGNQTMDPLAAR